MKPWIQAVLVLVALSVLGIVAGWSMRSNLPVVSCGAGSDSKARSCREAESYCRNTTQAMVAADGDGFSYGYECKDGKMTSFRYSGP